jgi:hypothetical protein
MEDRRKNGAHNKGPLLLVAATAWLHNVWNIGLLLRQYIVGGRSTRTISWYSLVFSDQEEPINLALKNYSSIEKLF